eukprot:9556945-Heterocapsa_arctica.AAC.1
MSWTGQVFWDVLKIYRQPCNAYHHGEPGNWCNISWLWDKLLFHIYLFCICNMASDNSLHNFGRLQEYMERDKRGCNIAPPE